METVKKREYEVTVDRLRLTVLATYYPKEQHTNFGGNIFISDVIIEQYLALGEYEGMPQEISITHLLSTNTLEQIEEKIIEKYHGE